MIHQLSHGQVLMYHQNFNDPSTIMINHWLIINYWGFHDFCLISVENTPSSPPKIRTVPVSEAVATRDPEALSSKHATPD